jgi:hypothetical protein
MKRAILTALALALCACNSGQPRIYRIAMDLTPATDIHEPTCFKNNQVPSSNVTDNKTNLYAEEQWVIWDATSSEMDPSPKQFLDLGHQAFKLGDSPAVDFDDVIGTTVTGTFNGRRTRSNSVPNQYVQTRQTTLTVKLSDSGASPTGTMTIASEYACVTQGGTCPLEDFVADPRNCSVDIPFSARRIDVSRISAYSEDSKGP